MGLPLAVALRALGLSLAVALVLVACGGQGPHATPQLAVAPTEAPAQAELPTPAPTPAPTPRPTPGPTVAPIAPWVVLEDTAAIGPGGPQTAFLGTLLEFRVGGLRPLESITIVEIPPEGAARPPVRGRADRHGEAAWRRDSRDSPSGPWLVRVSGNLGTQREVRFTLAEMPFPPGAVAAAEGPFHAYRTPEGTFSFSPDVHAALAVLVSQYYRDALPVLLAGFAFALPEPVDFYLVRGEEALLREVRAGGAGQITGLEAGISLLGFQRNGVYLDMNTHFFGLRHLVVHEAVHQITGRIDTARTAPLWLLEGLSEYEANRLAGSQEGDAERNWRFARRQKVRDAVEGGQWVDLRQFASHEQLVAEKDEKRLDLVYAEAFAAAEYVARQYGPHALRPLLEKAAQRSHEMDAVFQELFTMAFDDFQARVRDDVMRLDQGEQDVRALVALADALVGLLSEAQTVSRDWNAFVAARPQLSREQRAGRILALARANEALEARARALQVPQAGKDAHEVYLDSLAAFARGMEAFLDFEGTGSRQAQDRGNGALGEASFLAQATRDLLAVALGAHGLPADRASTSGAPSVSRDQPRP